MVEQTLAPPVNCNNCQSRNIKLTKNPKPPNKALEKWPYIYICLDCRATVGCHAFTFKPLGLMADKETRFLRKAAHDSFDKLWRSGLMSRDTAYNWLAAELKIKPENCHLSQLTKLQLRLTIGISEVYFIANEHIAERRKVRKNAKFARIREFEKQQIRLRKRKH